MILSEDMDLDDDSEATILASYTKAIVDTSSTADTAKIQGRCSS